MARGDYFDIASRPATALLAMASLLGRRLLHRGLLLCTLYGSLGMDGGDGRDTNRYWRKWTDAEIAEKNYLACDPNR